MKKNTQRKLIIGTLVILAIAALVTMKYLGDWSLPSVDEAKTFVPLNFSIMGMAGAAIYGIVPAILINWFCKIIGNSLAFVIGRVFGDKVLQLFPEDKQKKYCDLMSSEKSLLFFFVLSSVPYAPSDFVPYFLGASKVAFKEFLLVTFHRLYLPI